MIKKVELLNSHKYLEFLESTVNHLTDMKNIKLNHYISVLMLKMLDLESLAYWVQINPGGCKTGFDHIHGIFLAEFWPLTIKILYYKTTLFY